MNLSKLFILFSFLWIGAFHGCGLIGQDHSESPIPRGDIRIMFYNVENYFDTLDDPFTNDSEYLPQSDKRWNSYKYYQKSQNIFKTIAAVGGMRPPEIIGLAEIENEKVLNQLIWNTGLMKYPYGIAHYDSPDLRGIDVGMLYRKDIFELIGSVAIGIRFPDNPSKKTRDILYVQLSYKTRERLHIFVNHWPSRLGGQRQSEPARKYVASVLRQKVDSIFALDPCAGIIILGDFNDGPEKPSLSKILKAENSCDAPLCTSLYNLARPGGRSSAGSYRYQSDWDLYDQIIVSGSLQDTSAFLHSRGTMQIADYNFLLEEDKKYGGLKPRRSYLGPVYHGGFSDHLPVYVDLIEKSSPGGGE